MSSRAYTPALQVSEKTRVRKIRELPLPGKNLVKLGERVTSDQAVLSAELPGDLTIVRVADRMGFDPEDVIDGMKVAEGDTVELGQLLCEVKTFFNMFTTPLLSPASGTIEFFTERNAHLAIRHPSIPLSVDAYVDGVIVEVEESKSVTIETEGALIQGIFGVGGERRGTIFVLDVAADAVVTVEDLNSISEDLEERVIIGGASFTIEAIHEATSRGVTGIVCGSIDAQTLSAYVGYEIGVSITGDEEVPSSLIVTEGFGNLPISQRVLDLAQTLVGKRASINGATQVRAGAMRPEIIVPSDTGLEIEELAQLSKPLELGAPLRIIRVPHFGAFGEVVDLPSDPEVIPSGARVRVLRAKLESGEVVTVPRANVELI